MATGLELILLSICNATICEPAYNHSQIDESGSKNIKKMAKEINGKHLKIATYTNMPMSWVEENSDGTLVGKGVAFEIIEILREKLNFTYEVVTPNMNYELGGNSPQDSLVGLANNSLVDMVGAFLPKLGRYRNKVKFSYDLDEATWMMLLTRPSESAAGSGLLAPFDSNVWYLVLVAVLSFGPLITLLTRLRSRLVSDGEQYISLSPSVWFVYGSFMKQGTNLAPEANTTRVLFTTWWLFIILLSSFYTANLTAFLTLSKFTLEIESARGLYDKNYRWVTPGGGAVQHIISNPHDKLHYLSEMVASGHGEFLTDTHYHSYLPLVEGGAALIKERRNIHMIMYKDYMMKARMGVDEADRCPYVMARNSFMQARRAFAYPRGSNLEVLFDSELSYIIESGIIQYITSTLTPSMNICPLDLQSKDRQLRNSDLMMTYLIMVTGLAAALAVFIGEIFVKRFIFKTTLKIHKHHKHVSIENPRVRYDDSQPPPYDAIFGRKLKEKARKRIINGREYLVMDFSNGERRLIPLRAPSAVLYQLRR